MRCARWNVCERERVDDEQKKTKAKIDTTEYTTTPGSDSEVEEHNHGIYKSEEKKTELTTSLLIE